MSLKYRIAVTFFALEVLVIGAVLWITLGYSTSSVREQIAQTEEVTLQLLGDLSRAALLTDEFTDLQTFVEATQRDPRVKAVVVADAFDRVVVATDTTLLGSSFPELAKREHRYWRETVVRGRANALGKLAIEFSDYPLLVAYRETLNLGITIALSGMVVIAICGLLMGYVLTRRLDSLAGAADLVANGDQAARVEVSGRDEIARLGRAFNAMATRVTANLDALKTARDQLIQPTEAMSEGFALWDADDRLVRFNSKFLDINLPIADEIVLGMSFHRMARLSHEHVVTLDEDKERLAAWLEYRTAHHRQPSSRVDIRLRDGRWVSVTEFQTAEGGTIGIYSDISEARNRQWAIELGEQRLRAIMDAVIDGIVTVTADGTIESSNPAAAKVFDRGPDDLIGSNIGALIKERSNDHELGAPTDVSALPQQTLLEMTGRRGDGSGFPLELSVIELDVEEPARFILTLRDITTRKAAEEQAIYHATHDVLTGLPNRALFEDRLTTALKNSGRRREMLAVLFLDLDRFKIINDTLGHSIGDTLLKALSRRLSASVRDEDTVARMGGDEFIFIFRGLKNAEGAVKPAQKILEAIRPPFHVCGHELHVTASIGISLYPSDGLDSDELLKRADVALYRAKERGRDRLQLFNPTLNVRVFEQLVLERRLRRALEERQFVLLYQPQVALDTGEVVGVEALLRWRHPELGLVGPDEFVPLAEESGLIEPLGLWVLRTACLQHREWRRARVPSVRLAVNMSARQFQRSGLEKRVREVLTETDMEVGKLELELTESVLMQEGDSTQALVAHLADLGVSLALDDFGTGYSSLSYLKRFPIRRVKIDRSFVRDIASSEGDAALARAVIAMAHGLGVDVVAEGIETLEQLAVLRRYGCDEGQGFLLGRPVVPTEVPELVRRQIWPAARRSLTARAS